MLVRCLCFLFVVLSIVSGEAVNNGNVHEDIILIDNANSLQSDTATIIDILSERTEFSILLHHIQRTGLVPLINRSRKSTLVAPVNSAFFRDRIDESEITRDLLLYHLLNGTVLVSQFNDDMSSAVYESYLNDSKHSLKGGMPIVAERQKQTSTSTENDEFTLVFNHKATVVVPDLKAGIDRGGVLGVDSLLTIPKHSCAVLNDLATEFETEMQQYNSDAVSLYNALVQKELDCEHEITPIPVTSLVLSNKAFEHWNDIERSYILGDHAHDDREAIMFRHVIGDLVGRPLSWSGKNKYRAYNTIDQQQTLLFDHNYIINDTIAPRNTSIVASNGVMHIYDQLIENGPQDEIVKFNPQKYLWGLGADTFVAEALLRQLDHLIDGSFQDPQTIFVTVTNADAPPYILYHFVDEEVQLDNLKERLRYRGMEFLMTSKFFSAGMKPFAQRLKGRVSNKGHIYVNSQQVISDQIKIGNTSIYLLDGNFPPPSSLYAALGPFFQSSYSMEFLWELGLLSPFDGPPRTYLVPSRQAWEAQSLIKQYLQTNTTAMTCFFKSIILNAPIYTDDTDTINTTSLDGRNVSVAVTSQESRAYPITSPHSRYLDYDLTIDDTTYSIDISDVIFDRGVAQVIDKVRLPNHLVVTARNLIKAGGRGEFLELMELRNLSRILEEDCQTKYTILVPNMEVLDTDGYSNSSSEIDFLLSMHIVEGNPIDALFDGKEVETLASNIKLTGRKVGDNFLFVQLVNGQGHEVYITGRGDTSDGNTVLFLDKYVSPKWIPILQRPRFQLKTHVAILIGIACGVVGVSVLLVMGLYAFVMRDNSVKSDETRPLLGSRRTTAHSYEGAGPSQQPPTSPIPTIRVQDQREFGAAFNLPHA